MRCEREARGRLGVSILGVSQRARRGIAVLARSLSMNSAAPTKMFFCLQHARDIHLISTLHFDGERPPTIFQCGFSGKHLQRRSWSSGRLWTRSCNLVYLRARRTNTRRVLPRRRKWACNRREPRVCSQRAPPYGDTLRRRKWACNMREPRVCSQRATLLTRSRCDTTCKLSRTS